jgi:hypothetical protein
MFEPALTGGQESEGVAMRELLALLAALALVAALLFVALVVLDLDGSKKKKRGGKRSLEYGVELVLPVNPATRSVV